MKKIYRQLAAITSAAIMAGAGNTTAFADSLKKSDGFMYRYSDSGENMGKYTGWAKGSKGRYYYKKGVKVTSTAVIDEICYKFGEDGLLVGKYTGFVKNSKGKRYYKNGVLIRTEGKNAYFTYLSDNLKQDDNNVSVTPTYERAKDVKCDGEAYFLSTSTLAFIYGEGGCYALGDNLGEISAEGCEINEMAFYSKLTEAISNEPLGTLNYSETLQVDFDVTDKNFDGGKLYKGKGKELMLVSEKPYCEVDGTPIYLYTTATLYQ